MDVRAQVAKVDALLAQLHEEAGRARPRVERLRMLAEDLAWEFEPLRARLLGEEPLPDLRALSRYQEGDRKKFDAGKKAPKSRADTAG